MEHLRGTQPDNYQPVNERMGSLDVGSLYETRNIAATVKTTVEEILSHHDRGLRSMLNEILSTASSSFSFFEHILFTLPQDPDAEVELVLIPEKDFLDPESTPTFEDGVNADEEGKGRSGRTYCFRSLQQLVIR